MGYEDYTDEELMQMAGQQPDTGDASGYSDDELMEIANQKPLSGTDRSFEPPPPPPLSGEALNESLMKRTVGIADTMTAPSSEGMYGSIRNAPGRILDVAGDVAGFGLDVAGQGIEAAYKKFVPQSWQDAISGTAQELLNPPPVGANETLGQSIDYAPGRAIKSAGNTLGAVRDYLKESNPELLKHIESVGNIAAVTPMIKGLGMAEDLAVSGAKKGAAVVGDMSSDVISSKPVRWMTGRPDAETALKQVMQTKADTVSLRTKDLEKGAKALAAIDTTGIKSAEETIGKFNKKLPDLYKAVDDTLTKDPKVYSLDELSTVQKTKGGATVESNYVEKALEHLGELYDKTDDAVKSGNISELMTKATEEGLTKKEVNDIARTYNGEFGDKAFSAADVPLTSVNSETYRNVQRGLKEVSRRGLDDTAKELDSTISAIYNTRRLMERNAKAAFELKAKYDERGLGQKIGSFMLGVLDVATMGIAKGAAMKVIPRGWGFKIRNAVDIDEMYRRNLQIINKEIKRLEKGKTYGPTGPEEGPPLAEYLGMPNEPIPMEPFPMGTDVPRSPYNAPMMADMQRASRPALPPGQGFETYPVPESAPFSPELASQINTVRQLALPPGQNFSLYGEAYNPGNLPAIAGSVGDNFTMRPSGSYEGITPIQMTRKMIREMEEARRRKKRK